MKNVFAVVTALVALLGLASCSTPYDTPIIVREPGQQPAANFIGLTDLIDGVQPPEAPAQVLWAHGMCSHDPRWAADRINRVAVALGVAPELTQVVPEKDQPYYVNARFNTARGSLTITFLIWSPMTDAFKQSLAFDKPGSDGNVSFPYTRATLNSELKTGLINDCLSDAVVYAGRNGDPIRRAMQNAICNFLGGVFTNRQDGTTACDLDPATLDRPVAIVTESLGSKLVFDAVRSVWNQEPPHSARQNKLQRRLAAVSTVYLVSNQIPLLDLANPITSGRSSLEQFARTRGQGFITPPPLTMVAFSDPNDLLSYRLLPQTLAVPAVEMVNVTVSNDKTYFGFVERPDTAHCGYAWNRDVIGLITNGYRAGGTVAAPPVGSAGQCF